MQVCVFRGATADGARFSRRVLQILYKRLFLLRLFALDHSFTE